MAPEGMKCRNPAGNEGLLIEIGMSSTAFKSTSVFRAPGLILFATHWLWPRRGAGRPAGPQRRSQSVYGVHVLPLLKRLWVIGRPRLPITERTRDIFDSPPHQWLSGRIRLTPLAPRTIRHPAVMDGPDGGGVMVRQADAVTIALCHWHQGVFRLGLDFRMPPPALSNFRVQDFNPHQDPRFVFR